MSVFLIVYINNVYEFKVCELQINDIINIMYYITHFNDQNGRNIHVFIKEKNGIDFAS